MSQQMLMQMQMQQDQGPPHRTRAPGSTGDSLGMTQGAPAPRLAQDRQDRHKKPTQHQTAQQRQYQREIQVQRREDEERQRREDPGEISHRMHSDDVALGNLSGSRLRLRVLRAFNLRNTDLGIMPGDVSDPFVVVKMGRQEFKTEVIDNNLNPVWNSGHFEFAIESDDAKLVLEVFNSNQWHAHDSLGRMEIPVRGLTPNENHTVLEGLDEGDVNRDIQAKLEVEVKLLSSTQIGSGGYPGPGGGALMAKGSHAGAQLALPSQQHKKPNWVPLPSFKEGGPEAFTAPKKKLDDAPVGQARKYSEYESMASRLGQYDYSQAPVYYPKQEEVDKRSWKEDPFHGWRRDIRKQERQVLGDRNDSNIADPDVNWKNDPFHGWLKHDKGGHPEVGVERIQEARVQRELMSLPSFKEAPVKRFDDHREYVELHKVDVRQRYTDGSPAQPVPATPEQNWKDDAFFGWLPGRGPEDERKHTLHRPLEQARLARLPSFSEDPALMGISGHGVGIMRVWINGAHHLAYGPESGLQGKPSSCVKVRVGDSKEQVTSTLSMNANPVWNAPVMSFEVESTTDRLHLEVSDLTNPRSGQHLHQKYFLGDLDLDLGTIQDVSDRSDQAPGEPTQWREFLRGSHHEAQIDFEVLFEPYDTERATNLHSARRERNVTRCLPSSGSFRSNVSSEVMNHSGTLSVRVIGAYDLVNTDSGLFGDVSDPYVTVRLGSQSEKQRKRTATINNNLNPVWNTTPFLFPLQQEDDSLHLEVYDEDMLTQDDFLGRITIPLYRIIMGQPNTAVRIRDRLQDIKHGELEVEIGFTPE